MKKKFLSALQYLFFLALGIFLLWWSLRKVDDQGWTDIKNSFINARYLIIIPIVIALLASHYSRALRWKILMEPMGYNPRTSNTYLAVLIGYMANLAVPRLGEILKCTILARYEKVPADKLVGTIVAERAFDVVCLLIAIAVAIFTQTDIIGEYFSTTIKDAFGSKTGGISLQRLLVTLLALAIIFSIFFFLLRRFAHISFIQKIKAVIRGVWQGIISVKDVKKKGAFIFHTIFIWVMYLSSVRLGFFAMQETSVFAWKPALSVLSSGSLAMIMPSPGGLGFYPVFVQKTMELYGLKDTIGFAFGALMWGAQFFQMLLSGFVALLLLPFLNKKKKVDEEPRPY